MKDKLIWAYMMRISNHMWDDGANETTHVMYMPASTYEEENKVNLNTWDTMMKFLSERKYNMLLIDIGDGVKFDSHPEISAPDAWSKEFLKQKLDEARALGLEVIPKLNFSAGHDTWLKEYRRMVSTPIYYKVCADLIAEVCELFDHPRLFHLGLNDETSSGQTSCEMTIVRGEKLYWHDLFFLFKECEKNGARPWAWSDYYWNKPDLFMQNMPKEVLQSNWFHGEFKKNDPSNKNYTCIKTYEDLDKAGYEQVLTGGSFAIGLNGVQTVAHGKEKLTPELVKGYMTSPWNATAREFDYMLMWDADRMYQGRKKYYPETLGNL